MKLSDINITTFINLPEPVQQQLIYSDRIDNFLTFILAAGSVSIVGYVMYKLMDV